MQFREFPEPAATALGQDFRDPRTVAARARPDSRFRSSWIRPMLPLAIAARRSSSRPVRAARAAGSLRRRQSKRSVLSNHTTQWQRSDAPDVAPRPPGTERGRGPKGRRPGRATRSRFDGLAHHKSEPGNRLHDVGAARSAGEGDGGEPRRIVHRLELHIERA